MAERCTVKTPFLNVLELGQFGTELEGQCVALVSIAKGTADAKAAKENLEHHFFTPAWNMQGADGHIRRLYYPAVVSWTPILQCDTRTV